MATDDNAAIFAFALAVDRLLVAATAGGAGREGTGRVVETEEEEESVEGREEELDEVGDEEGAASARWVSTSLPLEYNGTDRREYPGTALSISETLIPLYETRVRTRSMSGECFASSSMERCESRPASSLVAGGSKTSSICLFETCAR